MLKKAAKFFVLMLVCLGVISRVYPILIVEAISLSETEKDHSNVGDKHQILNATVHISMVQFDSPQALDRNSDANETQTVQGKQSEGLGTLIEYNSKRLLVTHNHWGDRVDDHSTVVSFRSANGELLLEMAGSTFSQLVLYRDSGSLILEAPESLKSGSVSFDSKERFVDSGSLVYLLHQDMNENRLNPITLVPAKVTMVTTSEGLPTLKLESLNGESIFQGDSGGGIWFEGTLVGNMWRTTQQVVINENTGEIVETKNTSMSSGALLSAKIQNIIDMSFEEGVLLYENNPLAE